MIEQSSSEIDVSQDRLDVFAAAAGPQSFSAQPPKARQAGATLIGRPSRTTPLASLARLESPDHFDGWALTQLGEPGRGADQMEAAYRELLEAKQRAYLTFLGTLVAGARTRDWRS